MKKLKSIPVYFLLIVLCSSFITSCSEDPITSSPPDQPYEYDSARFDWDVDTLYGQGFYFGWAKDTNDIFITNYFENQLYRIKDNKISSINYPQNIDLGIVTWDEFNNGYIVGLELVDTIWQPFFQKFDGNTFVEIPNPQNLKMNFFFNAVFVKNSNEMWVGSDGYEDGFIVKFDGINLISYSLEDSRTKALKFFYDENNKFKLLASIHHLDTDKTEFVIYEFTGTQWIKIFSDLNSMRPLKYNILNKYVSAVNEYSIFELVDSSLIPRIALNPIGSNFSMGGYSFNNIIFPSPIRIQNRVSSLFHWNGEKWSLELSGYFTDPLTEVFMINENFYYVVSYDQNARTYLMQGRKKLF
jgi:hypothetical protein